MSTPRERYVIVIVGWTVILLSMVVLPACSRAPTPAPTPLVPAPSPTAGPRFDGGGVVASGEVLPALAADVSFALPGRVEEVAVAEGEQVQAGQVLARLERELLEAQVAQAQAALEAAQAQLEIVRIGARPPELAAAEAQVEAAEAALAQAAAWRDQPDVGTTEVEVRAAQSQVVAAQAGRLEAEQLHDETMTCVKVSLPGGEEQEICPALGTYEELARFSLQAAEWAQAAAQAQLDALQAGGQAEVRAAQAGVWAVAAQRDAAQAQLDALRAGPRAEEVAAAEARVAQAQAALQAAQAALEQATLRAPFSGTVVALAVGAGEAVMPAQVVLTLADLERLWVETTDLSERDVVWVEAGRAATVYVEPLDMQVSGQVTRVAPQATTIGGDVVYAVTIVLDEQPAGLRWGMTVQVEIAAKPAPLSTLAGSEAVGDDAGGDAVSASGEVVPAQEAQLGFPISGRVQEMAVAESDPVETGQMLTALETALLEAGVAQAEAGRAAAQAQVALLAAGPRAGEVAVAEAQVQAAQAVLAQTTARRDQLAAGGAQAQVISAQAQLAMARAEERAARHEYEQIRGGGTPRMEARKEEAALLRLRAAELALAAAEGQVAQAEQGVRVQERAAQAAVQAAAAQRDAAQARLDKLQAGTGAEELAAAQSQLAQAEATLRAAQVALEEAFLRAPFAGTVTSVGVSAGETVMPGQVVLTLADLEHLRVETTDLSERDVARVAVGQRAMAYVEALGMEIGGRVADVARQPTTIGGDVVYRAVIELDEQLVGLRCGMSVEVEIST